MRGESWCVDNYRQAQQPPVVPLYYLLSKRGCGGQRGAQQAAQAQEARHPSTTKEKQGTQSPDAARLVTPSLSHARRVPLTPLPQITWPRRELITHAARFSHWRPQLPMSI